MRSIWLFVVSLISITCKKEYSPQLTVANDNPTSYLLQKMTWDHTLGTNGQSFFFDYNADNLISEIKRVEWGADVVNGTPQWYFTTTYDFSYKKGLPITCIIRLNGDLMWYYEYIYKGNKIDKRILKYADGTIQEYTLYSYDVTGKLIEVVDSSDKVDYKHTLENSTSLSTSTTYAIWKNPKTKSKTELSSFDDKVNYIRAVNGLPATYQWDDFDLHHSSSDLSHNFGRVQYFWDVDIDKDYDLPDIMDYVYEYNEERLPTKMQFGGWTVTFEYQKYK